MTPRANEALYTFLLLSLFLILFPNPAPAADVFKFAHGEWEISPFGGVSFIGDGVYTTPVEGSTQTSRNVGLSFGTGPQLGFRLTNNRWQHWGAALEYNYSNQPITFTNLSDSTPALGLGHAIHRFAYDVLYYPRNRDYRLRPYVFAGPGVSLFYVKGSGKSAAAAQGIRLSDPWKFTMNWGGGVKYLLWKQVTASLQFSDSISGIPGYGLPEAGSVSAGTYVPGFRPKGYLNNWLIGVGLAFQWDER
jgi:opacity protein-like surface antigen